MLLGLDVVENALSQTEWDHTDAATWAPLVTKRVLIQEAIGDAQVSNASTRILARLLGLGSIIGYLGAGIAILYTSVFASFNFYHLVPQGVAFALREQGIKFRVVSRSRDRGDMTYALLEPIVVDVCTLIINTTPLGMHPDVASMPPLPYEAIGGKHVLIDLVYNPVETRFLQEGRKRGAVIANGLDMLHAQAEASWRIWNGA